VLGQRAKFRRMSINENELSFARSQPIYTIGIWAFRVMYGVLAVYIALMLARVLPFLAGPSLFVYLVLYLVAFVVGILCFRRVGVNITGRSDEVKYRRKIVYKDIFAIGARRP
jgi:hypothetical protein